MPLLREMFDFIVKFLIKSRFLKKLRIDPLLFSGLIWKNGIHFTLFIYAERISSAKRGIGVLCSNYTNVLDFLRIVEGEVRNILYTVRHNVVYGKWKLTVTKLWRHCWKAMNFIFLCCFMFIIVLQSLNWIQWLQYLYFIYSFLLFFLFPEINFHFSFLYA